MRTSQDTLIADGETRLAGLPLQLVDLGILAVIFFAPLFMGGRGPVGKFVFVSIVCATGVAWAVGQCRLAHGHWRRSGVEWLLLAGIALVALQLISLPQSVLARLSPSIHDLLPLWSSDSSATVRLGQWSTASLTPDATRGALIVLVAYIMLFLLVVQRIQSIEDVARILRWVAIGTIGMAVLGLLQLLVGNGKFLWIYEHPSRDTFRVVKGAFHNQNHFAHFLALGVGPLIWTWAGAPTRSLQKHLLGIGLGVVFVAGLLTFSRGGAIAISVASLATVVVFVWKSVLDKKALVIAGIMGAVVAVALLIHGYEPLTARFAALRQSRSLQEASQGRAALWSALLDGIPQFARLGSGIGSHRDVYPLFMEEHYGVEFTHGENGYLPLALEGGFPALLLMLTGIGICFWWCVGILKLPALTAHENSALGTSQPAAAGRWSSGNRHTNSTGPTSARSAPQRRQLLGFVACAGAIFPALLASVVHSLGDFVWYLSSCMSITVLLVACLCRLSQLSEPQRAERRGTSPAAGAGVRCVSAFPRPVWIGIAVLLVIVGTFIIRDRGPSALAAPHWYAYQRIALPAYKTGLPEEDAERGMLLEMVNHLKNALQKDPGDPRANIRFAAARLRQFELEQRHAINPMSLQQIREAALASQFASREAQDAWLNVAIGENKKLLDEALIHCRRGMRGCPLQGDGYVYLSELSFLEGPSAVAKNAYIDQASRVRPHSGVVAFAMGQERALTGDLDGALRFWRGAFHQDPQIRALIIEQFAASVPGEFFLENFQPERDALRQLKNHYLRIGQIADAQVTARRLVEKLLEQAKSPDLRVASQTWYELQGLYGLLEDLPAALRAAQRAVELDSHNLAFRQRLGVLLLQSKDYPAAARELQWCLRRKPDDANLMRQLTAAKRGDLEQRSAASPSKPTSGEQFQVPGFRL